MNEHTSHGIAAICLAAVIIVACLVLLKGCQIAYDPAISDVGKIKECTASGGEWRPITVPTTTTVYMSCVKPPK